MLDHFGLLMTMNNMAGELNSFMNDWCYTYGRPREEPFGEPCTRLGCHMNGSAVGWLVGWSLMSLFSTNMAMSETRMVHRTRPIISPLPVRKPDVLTFWDRSCWSWFLHYELH